MSTSLELMGFSYTCRFGKKVVFFKEFASVTDKGEAGGEAGLAPR